MTGVIYTGPGHKIRESIEGGAPGGNAKEMVFAREGAPTRRPLMTPKLDPVHRDVVILNDLRTCDTSVQQKLICKI